MKATDLLIPMLLGAVLLYWLFTPKSATADLGPNAKIGGKTVDTRYKGPLETTPTELPNTEQEYPDPAIILANPWAYL